MIEKLDEPTRALAAFYEAMGGSNCDGGNCELTNALGLGEQGSEEHKELINRYFPNDKVAETVIKQDCYLRPSGTSSFTIFRVFYHLRFRRQRHHRLLFDLLQSWLQ